MIDPGTLAAAGPIMLGVVAGLAGRRALQAADARRARRQAARRHGHAPAPRPAGAAAVRR